MSWFLFSFFPFACLLPFNLQFNTTQKALFSILIFRFFFSLALLCKRATLPPSSSPSHYPLPSPTSFLLLTPRSSSTGLICSVWLPRPSLFPSFSLTALWRNWLAMHCKRQPSFDTSYFAYASSLSLSPSFFCCWGCPCRAMKCSFQPRSAGAW